MRMPFERNALHEGWNGEPIGPDYAAAACRALLQLAQGVDLRRLERDPAQHHRQDDARAVTMDFRLSEEQRLLQDSVSRFVATEYSLERRRDAMKNAEGFSRANWRKLAELGLLGLPIDEAHGGSGGSPVDVMVVMEQFGRGLVVEPYLSTVIVAGGLVARAGNDRQKQELLAPLVEGRLLLAFAHGEKQARYTLADVQTVAQRSGGAFLLSGHKSVVLHGDTADKLIVSARTSGRGRDARGISLFLVDKGANGVSLRGSPTIDGLRSAEVTLNEVRVGPDAADRHPGWRTSGHRAHG